MTEQEFYNVVDRMLNVAQPEQSEEIKDLFEKVKPDIVYDSFEKIIEEEKNYNVNNDVLYEDVVEYFRKEGTCAVSLIQRKFDIGFFRACCIKERMEEEGIIENQTLSDGRRMYVFKK